MEWINKGRMWVRDVVRSDGRRETARTGGRALPRKPVSANHSNENLRQAVLVSITVNPPLYCLTSSRTEESQSIDMVHDPSRAISLYRGAYGVCIAPATCNNSSHLALFSSLFPPESSLCASGFPLCWSVAVRGLYASPCARSYIPLAARLLFGHC